MGKRRDLVSKVGGMGLMIGVGAVMGSFVGMFAGMISSPGEAYHGDLAQLIEDSKTAKEMVRAGIVGGAILGGTMAGIWGYVRMTEETIEAERKKAEERGEEYNPTNFQRAVKRFANSMRY